MNDKTKASHSREWIFALIIAAAAILPFANSTGGEFVYDDTRQIVRNTLIQDNALIGKALTSDVWAFKGDGSIVASNYWRPTFTAWNILAFRLFGTEPAGWHVGNLLLHTLICLLIFALLRRWAFSTTAAFVVALIFAVHPVHVESVSWIAGSPDLLFTAAFLTSLWFAQGFVEKRRTRDLILTIVFYAVALGAKEIGVLCLPIYYFLFAEPAEGKKQKQENRLPILLLAATALAYFVARWAVLGAISRSPDDPTAMSAAILSIPAMIAFYIRQIFFPYWVSASYPLAPVMQIGTTSFWMPLLICGAVMAGLLYLVRKTTRPKLGLCLFALPLLPALNATAFNSEHLVHDRYLYLPLLGAAMLIVSFLSTLISERLLVVGGAVLSAVLAIQTVLWSSAWTSELALWSWTTKVSDGPFAAMQFGSALADKKRFDEAIAEFSRSISKKDSVRAYLGRGRAYAGEHLYTQAESDLLHVVRMPPEALEAYTLYQTYEALGLVYSETGNFDAAERTFVEARDRLPIYSAAITEKLAIVLYQAGRKDDALRELEAAKERARVEFLPESKAVFMRLGMLYKETGQNDKAKAALREYLDRTSKLEDEQTVEDRKMAAKLLNNIR